MLYYTVYRRSDVYKKNEIGKLFGNYLLPFVGLIQELTPYDSLAGLLQRYCLSMIVTIFIPRTLDGVTHPPFQVKNQQKPA